MNIAVGSGSSSQVQPDPRVRSSNIDRSPATVQEDFSCTAPLIAAASVSMSFVVSIGSPEPRTIIRGGVDVSTKTRVRKRYPPPSSLSAQADVKSFWLDAGVSASPPFRSYSVSPSVSEMILTAALEGGNSVSGMNASSARFSPGYGETLGIRAEGACVPRCGEIPGAHPARRRRKSAAERGFILPVYAI